MEKKNLVVICGPTASGKTYLAVKTAEMLSDEKNKIFDSLKREGSEISLNSGINVQLKLYLLIHARFTGKWILEQERTLLNTIPINIQYPSIVLISGMQMNYLHFMIF